MRLKLVRVREYPDGTTTGQLYINDRFFCYTLEDKDRITDGGEKIWGDTAIPAGTYEIIISYSPRFKRQLPLLLNVKDFNGIRIHAGTTKLDTHGCILVGSGVRNATLLNSRKTFTRLFNLMVSRGKKEKIYIEILPIQGQDADTIKPA